MQHALIHSEGGTYIMDKIIQFKECTLPFRTDFLVTYIIFTNRPISEEDLKMVYDRHRGSDNFIDFLYYFIYLACIGC